MGKEKGGFLTPKAIANRIKSKGLQKLRWYCEMCQKQCRDENGFKCHMTSESHQRQLLLFAENPDEYIDSFSNDFAEEFLEVLRRRCGTKRIHANIVYQEYISNRNHVRMNSTQWVTLTDFVKWLGREGKCVVDLTEKGWFISYIDRDPETIKKQEAIKAKEKIDLDDEERTSKFIQKQIEKAALNEKRKTETEFTDLNRQDEDEKVVFLMPQSIKKSEISSTSKMTDNAFKKVSDISDKVLPSKVPVQRTATKTGLKRKSALDEIMEVEIYC
ncbi:DNA/RNA-binding protein KIN17 [Patella vulgata]|uniref:DNA/RNA-binding protein KIN17 n=1 Tax=Patella vulgata TaxID=6465 RepID=UPI00217FD3AD|nr:DNA/RNA-binding protein KIN17 [Patella vulgata]